MKELTHGEIMDLAWQWIDDLPITDDEEIYESNPDHCYLVADLKMVRDAIYQDIQNDTRQDEDLPEFFARHGIDYV